MVSFFWRIEYRIVLAGLLWYCNMQMAKLLMLSACLPSFLTSR